MTDPETTDPGEDRVDSRAQLLPEEARLGSDDPEEQAEAILEDSDARQLDRDAAPDTVLEKRRSEDVAD